MIGTVLSIKTDTVPNRFTKKYKNIEITSTVPTKGLDPDLESRSESDLRRNLGSGSALRLLQIRNIGVGVEKTDFNNPTYPPHSWTKTLG